MAYFPNGTSGIVYEEMYCDHCHHQGNADDGGCAVMMLHLVHNYEDEARKFLDALIPMDGIEAQKCKMFVPFDDSRCTKTKDMFGATP